MSSRNSVPGLSCAWITVIAVLCAALWSLAMACLIVLIVMSAAYWVLLKED
jgi:hypothetical protein